MIEFNDTHRRSRSLRTFMHMETIKHFALAIFDKPHATDDDKKFARWRVIWEQIFSFFERLYIPLIWLVGTYFARDPLTEFFKILAEIGKKHVN